MALVLSYDCPHCFRERIGFTYVGHGHAMIENKRFWQVLFRCNGCMHPVVAQFVSALTPEREIHGDLMESREVEELVIFPERKPAVAPEHVPEAIARAFVEAEMALRLKSFNAAAAMDRRTLELVTKQHAPERAGASLYQRIESLAGMGQLTHSLKTWAHHLRGLGNEALHEMAGIEANEARQMHELTRFILIYLYTLPQQIALARG